ncbi:E1-E2 ATPase-domain-containing protein [Dendryphion nanum]|uniref:E1-E2 ATPase-domain-containing protein n=1 Tax=Dendryphion nanum TaxID=256645 RepID=A0A9P9IXT9_9PLEO|nr:E1-E2 ATPase-domain-containing protein [Dendryphion nanum]
MKQCQKHGRDARDKYQSRLEAVGCICRALLALDQGSCCTPSRPSSRDKSRSNAPASTKSSSSIDPCCAPKSRTSVDSCCAAKPTAGRCNAATDSKCAESTCTPTTVCADACCDEKNPSKTGTGCGTTCENGCCGDKDRKKEKGIEIATRPVNNYDLEKGVDEIERVILSISGMTCTGCETKLSRTLATLPAVTKLKTSLVLSRAEFDLAIGITSAADVMKHLERTTEFKCERIVNQGSSIDLICSGNPLDIVKGDWPEGISEIKQLKDKKTVRVSFDAKIIGARDLIEKGWSNPMFLAPPQVDPTLAAGSKHVRHLGYATILSIILTIPVLVLSWAPIPGKEQKEMTFASISLALATIIQVVIAGPFYPKALKALIFSRVIEMDLLIVLSTSAAYVFSVVAFGYLAAHKPLSTGEFFETSTLLVTLIMVGRYIAALARQKAVESISVRSLQATIATVIDEKLGEMEIDARLLQYGDTFKVSPDSTIPTDGTVLSGSSEVNESMLTGESSPVEKTKGSALIAGSINGSGVLTVKLTRIPGDNTISVIANMVDEAKLSKPKIQEIADMIASYFVPVVVSITVMVFCIWIAVGVARQGKSGSESTIQAITYAITVLIVSCPCAIGLAVPMVIVIATGVAAEKGVVFKTASAIEVAHQTSHVVLDKTGTLTEGKLTVTEEEYLIVSYSSKALLLGLISGSKHPVAIAVAEHLRAANIKPTAISNAQSIVGKGMEGSFAGRKLRAGNSRWLDQSSNASVETMLASGYTVFCFTVNDTLSAVFGLSDTLRPDATSTVQSLQQNGIEVHILSGDDDGAVQKIAAQLRIPTTNVRSRCTPADKQSYIKTLLQTSSDPKYKTPIVVFCGDGTNDAVALAQATIGVHMNCGTDVAGSAADIVLMRPSLSGIITAINVSRKAHHRILFNFGWSFVYNLLAILLAAGAFVRARIPPEYAGLGELVSVLPVVAAGVGLKWAKV